MARHIPELLAPVGGWPQLKAAVQNGADAVYMGGPLFNARIKADNFSHKDMKAAIDYAHARNVNVYITLNTLIKDRELFRAFSYVNELYEAGADAVILQDLGLARLVRKYLPKMSMHLSTQGTVYNQWAVDSVKHLGFSRVVPARELTLQEIREFTAECHAGITPCEVEVFIHGALCMCYSGQCQMSRVLGGVNGRSGNRGLCAQPCRLPYEDVDGEKTYLLSPKDICTISDLAHLCQAGVDSLKIEGRLKSPQYVAVVTSIYRRYLDQYRDSGSIKVQADDMQKLTQVFNRGGFSTGYLHGNPGAGILSGDSPKNQGIYIGKVQSVKKGSSLVDVKLLPEGDRKTTISMGDGVEIRGKAVAGNVVTYLEERSESVARIGDIKERVAAGDSVYKVTDKALLTAAEKSYESDYGRKIPVEMRFTASLGEAPILWAREVDLSSSWIKVPGDREAERAVHKPMTPERVKVQLSKLGDTVFQAERIDVKMEDGLSLPVSLLNSMRREAADKLLSAKCRIDRQGLSEEFLTEIECHEISGREITALHKTGRQVLHIYSRETLRAMMSSEAFPKVEGALLCIPIELYMDQAIIEPLLCAPAVKQGRMEVMPYILNVSKGNLDRYIDENFLDICDAVRETGLLIGNLGWIGRFQEAGIKVYGDYGLNVYNGQCEKALAEMGVEILMYSHELQEERVEKIPLMITEHPISAKSFWDRKGAGYEVVQSASKDKYLIFQKAAMD